MTLARQARRVLRVVWMTSVFLMGIVIVGSFLDSFRGGPGRTQRPVGQGLDPVQIKSGDEILFVLIGAASCRASTTPELVAAVQRIREAWQGKATADGSSFATVGIAADHRVADGLSFLEMFGPFHEVIAGHNWLNSGVVQYVWQGLPGPASLPQLVIVKRHVTVGDTEIRVDSEQVLGRSLGADEIMEWAADLSNRPDARSEGAERLGRR